MILEPSSNFIQAESEQCRCLIGSRCLTEKLVQKGSDLTCHSCDRKSVKVTLDNEAGSDLLFSEVEKWQTIPLSPTELFDSLGEDRRLEEPTIDEIGGIGQDEPEMTNISMTWLEGKQEVQFQVYNLLTTSPFSTIRALFFDRLSSLHTLDVPELVSRQSYLSPVADIHAQIQVDLQSLCLSTQDNKLDKAIARLQEEATRQRDRFTLMRPDLALVVACARDALITAMFQTKRLNWTFRDRLLVGHLLESDQPKSIPLDLINMTCKARKVIEGMIHLLHCRKYSVPLRDGEFDQAYLTAVGLTFSWYEDEGIFGQNLIISEHCDNHSHIDTMNEDSAEPPSNQTSMIGQNGVDSLKSSNTSSNDGEMHLNRATTLDESLCPALRELADISKIV